MTWFDYSGGSGLVVNTGTALCFDLSPFSPPYVRLVRTDGGADTTVTAFMTAVGPN